MVTVYRIQNQGSVKVAINLTQQMKIFSWQKIKDKLKIGKIFAKNKAKLMCLIHKEILKRPTIYRKKSKGYENPVAVNSNDFMKYISR